MIKGVWLVAGTSLDQPYPCRCHERWNDRGCSAAWCPCAGRQRVNLPSDCCGNWFTAADHVRAMREWRIWKLQQSEG
jgi:hypothetical protein